MCWKEKLLSIENIENYNLYFVGINAPQKCNRLMFKTFSMHGTEDKIKGTLMQSNSLYNAYKEFLQYSYLNNKILLDVTTFLKSNKRGF